MTIAESRATGPEQWLDVLTEAFAPDRTPAVRLITATAPADLVMTGALEDVPRVPTWSRGRVVLVGDAAHINSPMGGVGLNSGIHDAMDITRRIARIRAGAADAERELATFAEVRHQVPVEYVQADTHRNTQRLRETDETLRRAAHDEMRGIAADLATPTGADLATTIDLGTARPDLAQLPYAIGDACDGACGGGLTCMTWLPAGYCSLSCNVNKDCPNGSSCVDVDGGTFCLRDATAGCPRSDARCISCGVDVCGPASFCDAC